MSASIAPGTETQPPETRNGEDGPRGADVIDAHDAMLPEMDEAEAAAFHAAIAEGIADGKAGRTMPADVFLAELRARYV